MFRTFANMPTKQRRKIRIIVGGYDPRIGRVTVGINAPAPPASQCAQSLLCRAEEKGFILGEEFLGGNIFGNCGEFHMANLLARRGSRLTDIRFVQPMTVNLDNPAFSTMRAKGFCDNCHVYFFDEIVESPLYQRCPPSRMLPGNRAGTTPEVVVEPCECVDFAKPIKIDLRVTR